MGYDFSILKKIKKNKLIFGKKIQTELREDKEKTWKRTCGRGSQQKKEGKSEEWKKIGLGCI